MLELKIKFLLNVFFLFKKKCRNSIISKILTFQSNGTKIQFQKSHEKPSRTPEIHCQNRNHFAEGVAQMQINYFSPKNERNLSVITQH